MKSKVVDNLFWKEFQGAIASKDAKKVAELSYFDSDDDKIFFIDTFEDEFDDIAVDGVLISKPIELKRITRQKEVIGNDAFSMINIPESINEIFTLKISYLLDVVENEEDLLDKEIDNRYIDDFDDHSYSQDFDFSDNDLDFFDDDEDIDYQKVYVFARVDEEFKYMGNYIIN